MLDRFFLWFVSFFGILSLFGIYLGYFHLIYAHISFIVIVLSGVVAYFIVRRVNGMKVMYSRYIGIILLVLLLLDVYVSLPYLIYPHSYVDFGLNVAQGRMITQTNGFPSFVHVYPNVYYGVFAIFNSVVLHAYSVSSVIAIIMQIMTAFVVFLIGKSVFDEKVGLIASFLYGFSLVNIMLLEQGYLTQNFATFFFVASMYLVIMCSKDKSYTIPMVLSLVGLMSYPHYSAVMFLAILVYYRNMLRFVLVAFVMSSIEIVGLVFHFFTHTTTLFNSFVMEGGIIVPNLFVLSLFIFGGIGYFKIANVKKGRHLLSFTNILVLVISIFVLIFLVNFFVFPVSTIIERNVRQLYTAVKILYLLFVPVSLLAAYQLKDAAKKWSIGIMIFFFIYFAFFTGYLLILPQKDNLPQEVYFMSENLSVLSKDNVLGFDKCLLQNSWVQPWIYDTLYGRPDNYTEFSIAEFGFFLQSSWAYTEAEGHNRLAEPIMINFSKENVDYYIADCDNLDEIPYYSEGNIRVYRLS